MTWRFVSVAAVVLASTAGVGCGDSTPEITPDDAAQVIRNNVARVGQAPNQEVACVTQEGGKYTFTCSVLTADGTRGSVVVRCQKPTGTGKNGRPNADCVAVSPGG